MTISPKAKAIVIPALIGLVGCAIATQVHHSYGLSLFLILPLLLPMLSTIILKRRQEATFGQCYWTSLQSIALLGVFIILMALDGIICLLMALPLTLLISLLGSALGYFIANKLDKRVSESLPLLILIGFPLLVGFEEKLPKAPRTHQVVTTIEVDAPIEKVWNEVIAFEKITDPPTGIFKLGIAYPIEARIEGKGVGAIRYCVFSTGPFVEPITRWEEPTLLCFDVSSNPPPMNELSPWGKLTTPHLQDTIISERGQFKLSEKDGKTILEGTTWYHQNIYPDIYWSKISSTIIHWIHLRVLNHIKECAERKTLAHY
jgi:hypothetical protein